MFQAHVRQGHGSRCRRVAVQGVRLSRRGGEGRPVPVVEAAAERTRRRSIAQGGGEARAIVFGGRDIGRREPDHDDVAVPRKARGQANQRGLFTLPGDIARGAEFGDAVETGLGEHQIRLRP